MQQNGLQELKTHLKEKKPQNFYIFTGEEAYLRNHYFQLLRKQIADGLTEEFNVHRFTEESFAIKSLAQSIEALPMLAERTLVQVDDIDFFKLPEEDRNRAAELLADIPSYCTVVLIYNTLPYKPDKRMKKLSEALSNAILVEFNKQNERELSDWIARHCKAGGKEISAQLCQYLIVQTGGTMTALQSELQKLTAYAKSSSITKADIDAVVDPVPDAVAFDLSNAIAVGNYELAVKKLQLLQQLQEDPISVLGAVGAQMRRILTAKALLGAKKGSDELAKLCGISSYPAQKTMEFARKLSQRFCDRAVLLCLETDKKLKSSYDDPNRCLELLVLQLAQEAKNG